MNQAEKALTAVRSWAQPDRALTWIRSLRAPHRLALMVILLVSTFFNFWQLGQNGYGNLYYAAAVKSMGSNLKAFFFVSLDPAGFVTVDKPPLGFWLQVLSTKIFGFTPWAIFLPQALAGVLSVAILYWLVRRHFGVVAGLIAALTLAVSPISVVTNRNNTIDSTLMLALLVATWATFRAVETRKMRWLILSAVMIGVGFNIKMLEAYLVVPAFALAYLLSSPQTWVQRLLRLAGAGVMMLSISLIWVLGVDIIPASLRPYVGSTQDNSELSLAFGYNGLQRLTGNAGAGGGGRAPSGGARDFAFPGNGGFGGQPPAFAGGNGNASGFTPPTAAGGNGGPGGNFGGGGGAGSVGMFNTGNPGLFRLFTPPLGGQIVWMLPIALIGILALAVHRQFRPRDDRQQQSLILWGTWLITMAVFFSVATFYHQYYLSQMAPAIAALAGIGIVTMWEQYLQPGWKGWLLPGALAVTALEQVYIIATDPTWGSWLIPVILVPSAIAALALAVARWRPELNIPRTVRVAAVTVGLGILLLTPTIWSAYPAVTNTTQDLPIAGVSNGLAGGGGGSSAVQVDTNLIDYLEAHQGSATYLVATTSSNTADPIILATGKAVMALGGFTGSDPILTTTQLQALVKQGVVKYFLLDGGSAATASSATSTSSEVAQDTGGSGTSAFGGGNSQSSLVQWVQQNCTVVSASAYASTGTGPSGSAPPSGTQTAQGGIGGNQALYVCSSSS
jgi:4-amino-4-deoxy-L-arabinose transferase-like glycosyltransferase